MTPFYIPRLPKGALEDMKSMAYQHRAVYIMKQFLEEFSVKELTEFASAAYGPEKFDTPAVAPVRTVDGNTHCLELWHGPTCAFKDMALQMLPHLLTASLTKLEEEKTACILVATSGDTGKGALEGFRDVPRTKILVFYPKDGVSQVQELQMVTQEGDNVGVAAVVGNFDDAQTGVKRLFSDRAVCRELEEKGILLLLGQLHQLGPGAAPDCLLRLGLLRPAAGREGRSRPDGERLCPHRQLRQHPGRLLRPGDRHAHWQADLRLQPEQHPHRLSAHRGVRPEPHFYNTSPPPWTS